MSVTQQDLLQQLHWRYAAKKFDPNRKLDESTWSALEESLILSPSSYGLQPWKFLVVVNQDLKDQMPAISWNQQQPKDCSHMVVLAARKSLDATYVDNYMETVTRVRELPADAMAKYREILVSTVEKMPEHLNWNARQVYIALGQLMVACAMLGVDTCPMEGIDAPAYDKLLGLEDSDYTSVVACAVGYRHPEDAQAQAKKVRFDASTVVTVL